MTNLPLIIQIQQTVLDESQSVTKALRLAKIAAAKLELDEFMAWVDRELEGYECAPNDLPEYRMAHGFLKGQTRGHWIPVKLGNADVQELMSKVPFNDSITDMEETVRRANGGNLIYFLDSYRAKVMEGFLPDVDQFGVELTVGNFLSIIQAVRNALLKWTIEMEKAGIKGENLMFTPEEKEKSEQPTSQFITNNHISVGSVGSFVQGDIGGNVVGSVGSLNMGDISQLTDQIDAQIPNLPESIRADVASTLAELKTELAGEKKPSVVVGLLKKIGDFAAKAGTNIAAAGLAAVIRTHIGL